MKQITLDIAIVWERCKGRCENPECQVSLTTGYENHHVYWKSQYKGTDRNEHWNLAAICQKCHYSIHSQANTNLDAYLKAQADIRKSPEDRTYGTAKALVDARSQRKRRYLKQIEQFKERNDGLSPTQVAYRRRKAFISGNSK